MGWFARAAVVKLPDPHQDEGKGWSGYAEERLYHFEDALISWEKPEGGVFAGWDVLAPDTLFVRSPYVERSGYGRDRLAACQRQPDGAVKFEYDLQGGHPDERLLVHVLLPRRCVPREGRLVHLGRRVRAGRDCYARVLPSRMALTFFGFARVQVSFVYARVTRDQWTRVEREGVFRVSLWEAWAGATAELATSVVAKFASELCER